MRGNRIHRMKITLVRVVITLRVDLTLHAEIKLVNV
jgi:hypothetical protein